MRSNPVKVNFAFSDHFAGFFDVLSHLRQHQLRVDFAVTFDKGVAERGWHELPTGISNLHVVSLNDVVDVGCD